jgi:hypothetical protein
LFIVIKMSTSKRITSQERCLAVLRYSRGEDDPKFHVKIGDNGIIRISRKKHTSETEHNEPEHTITEHNELRLSI